MGAGRSAFTPTLPQFDPYHTIFRLEWALVSALHPLTGSRASGSFTATSASSSAVVVPAGHYAVPVIKPGDGTAYADPGRMVKTSAETTVDPIADPSGTPIPFVSVTGGVRQNLDAGTTFEWYPEPPPGLTATAVSAAASSGGTDPTGLSAVRQVLTFEGLGQGNNANRVWAAGTSLFPAVIVAWKSATDGVRHGASKVFKRHQFDIFVIVTRFDGANRRRDEGKIVLSAVERELVDRAEVDGEIFSSPPAVGGPLGRLAMDPGSYVYTFGLGLNHTTLRTERRTFSAISKFRQQIVTPDDDVIQPPADPLPIVDQEQDVP